MPSSPSSLDFTLINCYDPLQPQCRSSICLSIDGVTANSTVQDAEKRRGDRSASRGVVDTAAAVSFVEAHPIGMWHFDGTIQQDQLQQYADLACTFVSKVYACEDWKDRDSLQNREALLRPEENVVMGDELPPAPAVRVSP